jgi:hypothetical protein
LHEHNIVADAGVGIDFGRRHPFSVTRLRAGRPAEKSGVIKVGDMLEKVDNVPVQPHLTGDQVRALVIGPKDSVVELHFLENPKRTPAGAYRVRLIRQPADLQGLTAAATSLNEIRGAMTELRNGKLPLVNFDYGDAYEGEWLNGKMHGRGIYTYYADGSRSVRRGYRDRGVAAAGRGRARAGVRARRAQPGEGCACL